MSATTETATRFVRVQRHPLRDEAHPWLVYCDVCEWGLFAGISFKPLGWAPSWRVAQDYAARHAARHQAAACQSCGHMKPLPKDLR